MSILLALFILLAELLGGTVIDWPEIGLTQVWIPLPGMGTEGQDCAVNLDVRYGEESVWIDCEPSK